MKPDQLGRVTTETIRKLVRLQLVGYKQLDSLHLEVRHGEKSVVVDLTTGHWESGEQKGKGVFSMGRYLNLDDQTVLEQWTKAAGRGR